MTLEMLNPHLPWRALTRDKDLLESKDKSDYKCILGARLSDECRSVANMRARLEPLAFQDEPPYNAIIADFVRLRCCVSHNRRSSPTSRASACSRTRPTTGR